MRNDPRATVRRFMRAREGATAIEYAIIAAGIAGAILTVVGTLGGKVLTLWNSVAAIFS